MSIPITSSITTWPGSLRPKWRSATLPPHEPATKIATIAAAWIAVDAGSSHQTSRPAADPNVPGATGA